jgi:hypothetical protein
MGLGALALASYLAIGVGGIWGIAGAALLAAFGAPSLKTALFASDREIREMTGDAPLSEETKRKFEDRL